MDSDTSVVTEFATTAYQKLTAARCTANTAPLTESVIRGFLPVEKRALVWDSMQRGFGVDISPPDRVRYFVHGRVDGVERRVTLRNAPYPHQHFKPKHARKMAQGVLAKWAIGEDPFAKPEPKNVTTLQQAARAYINEPSPPTGPIAVPEWKRLTMAPARTGKLLRGRYLPRFTEKTSEARADR